MNIIFQLSVPREICNKIFQYACKSPHNGLGIQVLKHFANIDDDDCNNLPSNDEEIVHFKSSKYSFINILKPLDIFKIGRFTNITNLTIAPSTIGYSSGIVGDIQVLRFMPKLVNIYIKDSFISGNIKNLQHLYDLQHLYIIRTCIYGDLRHISKLNQLITINLNDTNINGDIRSIKTNKSLVCVHIHKTNISTYYFNEFNSYRNKHNLPGCPVVI